MTNRNEPAEAVFTPSEVAELFRVDAKTVTRWAAAGRLPSFRTPGGHRRYRRADVDVLLNGRIATPPADAGAPLDDPMVLIDIRDGRVVLDGDCPQCGGGFRYTFTPSQARAAAAQLLARADEVEGDTR